MTSKENLPNIHTNIDSLSKEELAMEASKSKKNARVKLLQCIHHAIQKYESMETAYGYDPQNDMSFTGEFEAIGS